MTVTPQTAAEALTRTWQLLLQALPGGWTRRGGGAIAAVTGVAQPTLNGVWVEDAEPDVAIVAAMLAEVAQRGVPYCLQFRPGAASSLETLAPEWRLSPETEIPLMVRELAAPASEPEREVSGMLIRELAAEDAALHAGVAAAGFEAPEAHFRALVPPVVLQVPGVRCYVGELDGEPVCTGIGVTVGDEVGIFNIATPAAHRRRGYGAAVTARAIDDGLADGAGWAWLQSSHEGYGVYEQLGFRAVEFWQCWIAEG